MRFLIVLLLSFGFQNFALSSDHENLQIRNILVKLKPNRHIGNLPSGLRVVANLSTASKIVILNIENSAALRETLTLLNQMPEVEYAEPDYVVKLTATTPNDPLYSGQWDMQKIDAPLAWDLNTNAQDVVVAVLDTGIDFTHPDLAANLWSHPKTGENGYVAKNGRVSTGGADDHGHGTHCAGTIGAAGNNSVGVAGINWNVKLMALKFLDAYGMGEVSNAIALIDKLIELKKEGVNVRLTSNSWGTGEYSRALEEAFGRLESAGILSICASGNNASHADLEPLYPGAFESHSIISVNASDSIDKLGYFSNYGLASTDIAAPGVKTLSTVPTGKCSLCDDSGYKILSGTSMATPHVSGVAAAVFAQRPQLTASQVRDIILDPLSLDLLSDAHAADSSTGGRLNMFKALTNSKSQNPRANQFPVITFAKDVTVNAGSAYEIRSEASDADGDPLRSSLVRFGELSKSWLFESMMSKQFQSSNSNIIRGVAPWFAIPTLTRYMALFADGRGGSVRKELKLLVGANPNPGQPPIGVFSASPLTGPIGTKVNMQFDVRDPEGGQTAWDVTVLSKSGTAKYCCNSQNVDTYEFNSSGVYRLNVQAIDNELLLSKRESVVIKIGGATGEPPLISVTNSSSVGTTPLTVSFDMSGSTDSDGKIATYRVDCLDGLGDVQIKTPQGSCTFTKHGPFVFKTTVIDNDGNRDSSYIYGMAL